MTCLKAGEKGKYNVEFPDTLQNKTLRGIAEKVCSKVPVSKEDALYMLTTDHILDLGAIAHHIRTKLHGDIAYYGVNMNLNYTNICELRCPLCAYSCDENNENAFLLSIDEIDRRIRKAVLMGIDEVHIVGGLHPDLGIDYFEQMLRRIKKIKPDIHIVGFTAVEYDYFAKKNNIPLEEVFKRFIDAGVEALPGGGAEIFSPRVRDIIAPKKISGSKWLSVMRTAHKMGLKTNATLLYNHIETPEDIVDHLSQIRDLQDETGGFKTFVPLQFHGENTKIDPRPSTTGYDDIRIYAASRVFLHNVPHLKALWMYLGDKMAQVLLRFGVDDIGATYHNEKVVHAAGAQTPDFGSEPFLRRLIHEAQLIPERTTASYPGSLDNLKEGFV
jgi:aminodeoxyfutalosine synthase